MSRRIEPWPERDRLEWQLRWHKRKLAEAEHWISWADLPEEKIGHWRFIRKVHTERVTHYLTRLRSL